MNPKLRNTRKIVGFLTFFLFLSLPTFSQRNQNDIDSSFLYDTVRPVIKRFENLRISGYMLPQFQVAQSDGAPSFEGGNFSPFSRSRFMIREARVKIEYLLLQKDKLPKAQFVFQTEATERGITIKDMYIRLFETKKNLFSVTAGFFTRPFGFELNLSNTNRESPERGRLSQTLMPGERDLGVMLSFEPQKKSHKLYNLKLDAGFFNGPGSSGPTDFDSYKDFISRLTIKPYSIEKINLSGGLSILRGGWKNGTKYVFNSDTGPNGEKIFVVDSSESNLGKASPRHYYGSDLQVVLNHGWGETEWRVEYWFGTQPGTANSTANPGNLPASGGLPLPTYVRHFDGAFFYFLQNIINPRHQLVFKYDWYDPNIKVESMDIGKAGNNLTAADIKFSSFGSGYVYHINPQIKLTLFYSLVKNEITSLPGFTSDLKDDVFTARLQFRF